MKAVTRSNVLVREWQLGRVGNLVVAFGVRLARVPDQRRRRVDTRDGIAPRLQISRQPALPAADIKGAAAGQRKKSPEHVAVESPVGVVPGRARPRDPVLGVGIPRLGQRPGVVRVSSHTGSHRSTEDDGRRVDRRVKRQRELTAKAESADSRCAQSAQTACTHPVDGAKRSRITASLHPPVQLTVREVVCL